MKVKDLIQHLQELPEDYSVELSKVLTLDDKNDAFEITLDFPIVGLAINDEAKDCNLVVSHDKTLAHFAKSIKKLV